MEACPTAHYSAREIAKLGHDIRLLPSAYVKPFVKDTLPSTRPSQLRKIR